MAEPSAPLNPARTQASELTGPASLIAGSVALVTGANGGLGEEFVRQLLDRGAAKVYATARRPRQWDDERVVGLPLDVTDDASTASAAAVAGDITLLINNAGIARRGALLSQSEDDIRAVFETNFFGAIRVVRTFAPVLIANAPSAVIDVHSVMSWQGQNAAYSAAKAALWSATNTFRLEMDPHRVHVLGLHLSWTTTPMTKGLDREMGSPQDVAEASLDGLAAGQYEVLADAESREVKAKLSGSIEQMYPQLRHAATS